VRAAFAAIRADAFAASQEFMNRYGAMNNSDYVSTLTSTSWPAGDPTGLADWVRS